jgi:prefoldin subunit 5
VTEETKRLEARLDQIEAAVVAMHERLALLEAVMAQHRDLARQLSDAVAAALKLIGDRTGRGGGPAAPLTGVN